MNDFLDPGVRSAASWLVSGSGGAIARIATDGTENNDSLEISGSIADGGARMANAAVNQAQSEPRSPRQFSFDARAVSGNGAWRVVAFEFSSAGSLLSTLSFGPAFTATESWGRFSFTYTPVTPTVAYTLFGIRRNESTAAAIRIDQVVVQRPSQPLGLLRIGTPHIGPLRVGKA